MTYWHYRSWWGFGQTITHKIWIMITKWILSWCVFFITKNVMVFESRFLFAQLESNAFVLLTIWTQTNEYLTFITSPSPTVYTVLFYRCVTYKFQTFSKSVYNWLPKKKQLKIKLIIITENSSWYSFLWKYYQSGPPHHQKSSLFPDQEGFVPVPKHSELVWDFVFWCQLLDKHRRVLQFLVCSIQT